MLPNQALSLVQQSWVINCACGRVDYAFTLANRYQNFMLSENQGSNVLADPIARSKQELQLHPNCEVDMKTLKAYTATS